MKDILAEAAKFTAESHTASIAQARAEGKAQEEAACVKRGHLTAADLKRMLDEARREGIEEAARRIEIAGAGTSTTTRRLLAQAIRALTNEDMEGKGR